MVELEASLLSFVLFLIGFILTICSFGYFLKDQNLSAAFFSFLFAVFLFIATKSDYDELSGKLPTSNKKIANIYKDMVNEVDNHRLFHNYDLVDQRALLLLAKPTFGYNNSKVSYIESLIYREFRAGSLDTARNWKGLFTMFANYLELKGTS